MNSTKHDLFILHGALKGDLDTIIVDKKFLNKNKGGKQFNPSVVYNLCKALFDFASDVEGGKLKNLDMKYYECVTKKINEFIIIMGVEKSKKIQDDIAEISPFLPTVSEILRITDKDKIGEDFPDLFKDIPILRKEIKKMIWQ